MTPLTPLQLLLAKSLCSCREWLRASATLAHCTSSTCVFFRNYAKYMAGEKAKCDADAGRREALESVDSSNACAAPFNCIACSWHVTHVCAGTCATSSLTLTPAAAQRTRLWRM